MTTNEAQDPMARPPARGMGGGPAVDARVSPFPRGTGDPADAVGWAGPRVVAGAGRARPVPEPPDVLPVPRMRREGPPPMAAGPDEQFVSAPARTGAARSSSVPAVQRHAMGTAGERAARPRVRLPRNRPPHQENMVRTLLALGRRPALARAADEFLLTTILLFLAVTVVRWMRDPDSALYIADLGPALAVIGAVSGAILTGLILSPPGRRSGGHVNPAVTVALWLMGAFPGRRVLPYAVAQLAGSAAGTGLARLVWGRAVALPSVAHAVIRPAPTWEPVPVFLAETGGMAALTLVVAYFVVRPRHLRLLPYAIGTAVGLVIALFGPASGGSVNPARQFGPAAFSGQTTDLAAYLVAPILGAILGAVVHHVFLRRLQTPQRTLPVGGTARTPARGDPATPNPLD